MDILRRVLESHYHYHIRFVMNVTDIDDKIIKRARLNYLLEQHLRSTPDDSKASSRQLVLSSVNNTLGEVLFCSAIRDERFMP